MLNRRTMLSLPRCRSRGRGGFTLAEALIASIVLAIVAASAALPFAAGYQQVSDSAQLEQAVALGEAMMEEILARPFFDPEQLSASLGPEVGENTRDQFNNIDDFSAYSEANRILRNFDDGSVTKETLQGFWRSVLVEYVTFPGQAADDVDSLVHIQVLVFHGNRLLVRLDRIASREY